MPRLGPYFKRKKPPPFDQHEVAALIAPRPLLVFSGYHDEWCPGSAIMGEFTAAFIICTILSAIRKPSPTSTTVNITTSVRSGEKWPTHGLRAG